jgi:multidrug efflux pump subunit AcrB
VRFKDIGRVELGAQDYSSYAVLNGKPAAMLVIYQYNDGNGMEIARQCKETMKQLSRKFPAGMAYSFTYDTTLFVKASIKEMVITLFEAIALVVFVTFIFLQDWRATLVPTIAIPVSLLATFVVLQVAGFSLNLISLLAMILAIGIVVDDAIEVIENVNRLMEEEGLSPRDAAIKSMDQVTAPIIATTAVLLAMFVPICFVSGITGALYRQFGITISVSVAFSAINALTLSTVLAAMLLKPPQKDKKENLLKKFFSLPFRTFNYCFNGLTSGYTGTVKLLVRWSFLILVLYLGISVFAVKFFNSLPTGFLPPEDLGAFFVNVQLPTMPLLSVPAPWPRKFLK